MSPARRLIILAGFTLMVAGIVLLLSQEEEIFVALSVLGFVVVVAAVPRLQRERDEAGAVPATGVQPAAEVEPATDAQPPTEPGIELPPGNATVVPSEPTLEHAAVEDSEASEHEQEPQPEPAAPPPAAVEPAPAATPVPAPASPELAEPAPSFPAPKRPGTWQPPSPPANRQAATGPGGLSARNVAVAGTAAGAAGALLWAWRRARR